MVVSCPLSPRAPGWPCRMAVCCPAMSQSPEREGWRLPGGTVAGCHVGLEGKKNSPFVFSAQCPGLWHCFVILAVLAIDKHRRTIYIPRQTGSDMVLLLFSLLNWANRKRQQLQWWE